MKWMLIVMVLGVTPVKTGLLFDTLDACRQVAGEMEAEYARYINEGLAWAATQSKTGKVSDQVAELWTRQLQPGICIPHANTPISN